MVRPGRMGRQLHFTGAAAIDGENPRPSEHDAAAIGIGMGIAETLAARATIGASGGFANFDDAVTGDDRQATLAAAATAAPCGLDDCAATVP